MGDFFAGYLIGSSKSNSSSSGGIGVLILAVASYFKLKAFAISNENKLMFFFLVYLILLFIIRRCSYKLSHRSLFIIILREILRIVVVPLSCILGLIIAHKIGGTPLHHLINWIDSISNYGFIITSALTFISLVLFLIDFIIKVFFFKFIETFFAIQYN